MTSWALQRLPYNYANAHRKNRRGRLHKKHDAQARSFRSLIDRHYRIEYLTGHDRNAVRESRFAGWHSTHPPRIRGDLQLPAPGQDPH